MKFLVSALLVVVGFSVSTASFDLMLIPDTSSNAGVVRYDPINRIRLGFIGADAASPWNSVNLSSTSGKVWMTGAQTMLYDYSTGLGTNANTFPVGNTTGNIGGTRFVESFGLDNYFYDENMVSAGQFTGSFSDVVTAAPIGTNRVAMIGLNGGNINLQIRNNSNGALTTRTLVTAGSFTAGTVGTATVLSDNGTTADLLYSYRTATGLRVEKISINISTLASTSSILNVSGYSTTYTAGILRAHNGYYVVGRDIGGTSTRITAVSSAGVVYSGYTTTDFMTGSSRWVGANVVAPEPNCMIALGLGLVAFVRKRRRADR